MSSSNSGHEEELVVSEPSSNSGRNSKTHNHHADFHDQQATDSNQSVSSAASYQQGVTSSSTTTTTTNDTVVENTCSTSDANQSTERPSETNQSKLRLTTCDITLAETNSHDEPNDIESDRQLTDQNATTSATAATNTMSIPGAYPPEWLPDNETDSCMSCDCLFTLIKRRHHCRSCGKIFCSDCCRHKAKLLYLNLKEARVCSNCFHLLEQAQVNIETGLVDSSPSGSSDIISNHRMGQAHSNLGTDLPSSLNCENNRGNGHQPPSISSVTTTPDQPRYRGVLKTGNHSRSANSTIDGPLPSSPACSSSTGQQNTPQPDKQVTFSDGIRPGTDLTEPFTYPISSVASGATSVQMTFPMLARQTKSSSESTRQSCSDKKSRGHKSSNCSSGSGTSGWSINSNSIRTMTVCDELGYLPPVVINKDSKLLKSPSNSNQSAVSSLSSLIMNQFKLVDAVKSVKSNSDSSSSLLKDTVKFSDLVETSTTNGIVIFILLRDYFLRVKLVTRVSQENGSCPFQSKQQPSEENTSSDVEESNKPQEFWCFLSEGLSRFGQQEVLMVLDKNPEDSCLPRDVFKIFVTLHELALRRQTIGNLGNLLFQDGLFDNRDNAGIIFVRPLESHRLDNLIIPDKPFLIALVLQRCEIPWSKVFPVRLLLRLGHKYNTYPYPLVSYKSREPVYYEVGHTIISILGDFRNFRYSLTHVDGLRVMINKSTKRVVIQLDESSYQQFNKVLDASSNEHVLAWSSYPFLDADGHMVCIQNEEGHYETTEFFKDASNFAYYEGYPNESDPSNIIGVSFVIFSGALKANQSGQPAKISIVEDGLLIQIQSCTMSALKSAIHYMHHFDIDCETDQDLLNRVELNWLK